MKTAFTALLLVLAAQERAPVEEQALVLGLDEVTALLVAGEHGEAMSRLEQVIEQHSQEPYAWLHRPRLVELLARTAFLETFTPPAAEDMVSGDLERYAASSGQLRVRYELGRLKDFYVPTDEGEFVPMESTPEPDDVLFHPARFSRNYEITIKGSRYRKTNPPLTVVLIEDGQEYHVTPGIPGGHRKEAYAEILHGDFGELSRLDRQPPPEESRLPFEFSVEVTPKQITAKYDGKRLLRTKKPVKGLGSFALYGLGQHVDEIEVRGRVQRSWMRGLEDERHHVAFLEFQESFDESQHVPEALELPGDPLHGELIVTELPQARRGDGDVIARALSVLGQETVETCLDFAEELPESQTSEVVREYVRGLIRYYVGDADQARVHCRRLLELSPEFVSGQILEARILTQIEGFDEGRAAFDALLESHPENELVYAAAVDLALLDGRLDDVESLIRRGAKHGAYGRVLEAVNAQRAKALAGPTFLERYEVESEHFRIVSDIDKGTCVEASRVLETMVDHLAARLLPPRKGAQTRFPVYLFSGHAGYLVYTRDVLQRPAESSWGVYLPPLKQLLIWNAPDRQQMLNTIRHEGVHQYLDRQIERAPHWLQEGIAEYWELADFSKSASRQDDPTEQQRSRLRVYLSSFTPWNEMVRLDPAAFMRKPGLHYTESWAFIHFLMNDGRETRVLLKDMLADMASGTPVNEAMDKAFAGLDPTALQIRFERYCEELARG